jgi:hypothetical protein
MDEQLWNLLEKTTVLNSPLRSTVSQSLREKGEKEVNHERRRRATLHRTILMSVVNPNDALGSRGCEVLQSPGGHRLFIMTIVNKYISSRIYVLIP